jgi:hypothetical protein
MPRSERCPRKGNTLSGRATCTEPDAFGVLVVAIIVKVNKDYQKPRRYEYLV